MTLGEREGNFKAGVLGIEVLKTGVTNIVATRYRVLNKETLRSRASEMRSLRLGSQMQKPQGDRVLYRRIPRP